VDAVTVRDGDVLIIGVSTRLTVGEAADLKAQMMGRLPGLADVIIMTDVTALATYRGASHDEMAQSNRRSNGTIGLI
jgi:hypothetical protein